MLILHKFCADHNVFRFDDLDAEGLDLANLINHLVEAEVYDKVRTQHVSH
jgi:hypothetical protein